VVEPEAEGPAAPPPRPVVLVVDDDPTVGRFVRLSLEIEGVDILDAANLAEARPLLRPGLRGIVLDRTLPDGDGLDLLPDVAATCPDVPVVVFSGKDDGREPPSVQRVAKPDIASVFEALGLGA
jgi:DNA-binding NtrC family response regulator